MAVHCKNGKGRTGVVVCAWLLYSSFSDSALDAMQVFSRARLGPKAKVEDALETPSQRRYVHYMQEIVRENGYRTNRLMLKHITMHTCPRMDSDGGCDPWFMIEENGQLVFDWSEHHEIENMDKNKRIWEARDINLALSGDIRVVFFDHDALPFPRDELVLIQILNECLRVSFACPHVHGSGRKCSPLVFWGTCTLVMRVADEYCTVALADVFLLFPYRFPFSCTCLHVVADGKATGHDIGPAPQPIPASHVGFLLDRFRQARIHDVFKGFDRHGFFRQKVQDLQGALQNRAYV